MSSASTRKTKGRDGRMRIRTVRTLADKTKVSTTKSITDTYPTISANIHRVLQAASKNPRISVEQIRLICLEARVSLNMLFSFHDGKALPITKKKELLQNVWSACLREEVPERKKRGGVAFGNYEDNLIDWAIQKGTDVSLEASSKAKKGRLPKGTDVVSYTIEKLVHIVRKKSAVQQERDTHILDDALKNMPMDQLEDSVAITHVFAAYRYCINAGLNTKRILPIRFVPPRKLKTSLPSISEETLADIAAEETLREKDGKRIPYFNQVFIVAALSILARVFYSYQSKKSSNKHNIPLPNEPAVDSDVPSPHSVAPPKNPVDSDVPSSQSVEPPKNPVDSDVPPSPHLEEPPKEVLTNIAQQLWNTLSSRPQLFKPAIVAATLLTLHTASNVYTRALQGTRLQRIMRGKVPIEKVPCLKKHEPYNGCLARVDPELHELCVAHSDPDVLRYHLLLRRKTRTMFYNRAILPEHIIRADGHVRDSCGEMARAIHKHWKLRNLFGIVGTQFLRWNPMTRKHKNRLHHRSTRTKHHSK